MGKHTHTEEEGGSQLPCTSPFGRILPVGAAQPFNKGTQCAAAQPANFACAGPPRVQVGHAREPSWHP